MNKDYFYVLLQLRENAKKMKKPKLEIIDRLSF
jgi:hypothetical protein